MKNSSMPKYQIVGVSSYRSDSEGGSMEIGNPVIGATAWQVLYPDAAGDLSQDAGFIRDLSTGITSFSGTGTLDGSTLSQFQGDSTIIFLGAPLPFEGNYSSTTNGDFTSSSINAHLDVSSFASQPPGTFFAEQSAITISDSNTGDSASAYTLKLPGVFGGELSSGHNIELSSGLNGNANFSSTGTDMEWRVRITDNSTFDNRLLFSDLAPLEWQWAGDTIWKMPTVQGTAGDTMVLDTDGETLIWGAGGAPTLGLSEIGFGDATTGALTSSNNFAYREESTLGNETANIVITNPLGGSILMGSFGISSTDVILSRGVRDFIIQKETAGGSTVGRDIILQGGPGDGTDFAGGNTVIRGGASTGTGNGGDVLLQTALPSSTGNTQNTLSTWISINGADGTVFLGDYDNVGNSTSFSVDDANQTFQFFGGLIKTNSSLPAYADDTAAGVGGLTAGDLYQTTGAGSAPLNVAGIVMAKQ